MKKLLFILSIFAVGLSSCKKEKDIEPTPTETPQSVADFSFHQSTSTPGQVTFTNLSSNFDYSEWKFGDGNESYSDDPVHTYTQNGSYTVKLTSKSYAGSEHSIVKTVNVSGITAPPTTGQRLFWMATANYGEITIKVNGGNVGTITNYMSNGLAPECGSGGFVTIERPAGTYSMTATSTSGHSWSFTFTIENGICKKTQLT